MYLAATFWVTIAKFRILFIQHLVTLETLKVYLPTYLPKDAWNKKDEGLMKRKYTERERERRKSVKNDKRTKRRRKQGRSNKNAKEVLV